MFYFQSSQLFLTEAQKQHGNSLCVKLAWSRNFQNQNLVEEI